MVVSLYQKTHILPTEGGEPLDVLTPPACWPETLTLREFALGLTLRAIARREAERLLGRGLIAFDAWGRPWLPEGDPFGYVVREAAAAPPDSPTPDIDK